MKYTIAWSGGKDSTASVILAHKLHIQIREIKYIRLMWNKYIPADLPIMDSFIQSAAKVFEDWDYKVSIVSPQKTGVDLAYARYQRPTKPKERKGKIYGIGAFIRGCCCMTKYKKISMPENSIVGIASDEPERVARLFYPDRSLLAENNGVWYSRHTPLFFYIYHV